MKCRLCESENIKFVFNYSGKDIYAQKLGLSDFKLAWYSCADCGVFFSIQPENIESVYSDKNLYDAQYTLPQIKERFEKIMQLPPAKSDNSFRVKRVKSFYKRYLKLTKPKNKHCKILDIGAGMGVFLAKFPEKIYQRYALELNPVACEHLKNTLNIEVFSKPVEEINNLFFNLITLNKVVEHLQNPFSIMFSLRTALETNGIIYIELPDTIGYEQEGATCDAFACGHYFVYNSQSLQFLLQKSGFEILCLDRILEPSGKYSIFAFARRSENEVL